MKKIYSTFQNILSSGDGKVILLGAIMLLLASCFSQGYHQFDEHFQIIEYGAYKLGITPVSDLAWEFPNQMRQALQPGIFYLIHGFFNLLGMENPFHVAFVLRLISAILTFVSIFLCYRFCKKDFLDPSHRQLFLFFSFLMWFVVYNGVRFSSESWSGSVFLIAFVCYFNMIPNGRNFILLGILFGLAFVLRYQTALMFLGLALWMLMVKRESIDKMLFLGLGFVFSFTLGVFIDKWFYGDWVLSSWNYFYINIYANKSMFGSDPWWWYFVGILEKGLPPLSILIIIGFYMMLRYQFTSPLTWVVLPFFFTHMLIGHKEIRFLFPLVGFVPYIIVYGFEVISKKMKSLPFNIRLLNFFKRVLISVNCVALVIVVLKPADAQISLYKALYNKYSSPIVLYHVDSNPYLRTLNLNYYKRSSLSIKKITSMDQIPTNTRALIVLRGEAISQDFLNSKLVYTSVPEWLLKFDLFNMFNKAKVWRVYEIEN